MYLLFKLAFKSASTHQNECKYDMLLHFFECALEKQLKKIDLGDDCYLPVIKKSFSKKLCNIYSYSSFFNFSCLKALKKLKLTHKNTKPYYTTSLQHKFFFLHFNIVIHHCISCAKGDKYSLFTLFTNNLYNLTILFVVKEGMGKMS